jgi:hypothetical protein
VSSSALSSTSIEAIKQRIASLRDQLARHPLYAAIRTLEHLRIFMESHVFAVWDFMSLLKSLQRALTTVDVPWVPTVHPASCRFINEIVLGEESDDYEGRSWSHFEIYLEAMRRAGANSAAIERTVEAARHCRGGNLTPMEEALQIAPASVRQFVRTTFRIIGEGSVSAQAAAFTFGREDTIPDIFRSLVRDLNLEMGGDLRQFIWYLERHIEVDGGDHGPLSLRMVADLCGDASRLWSEAAQAAEDALRSRLSLWNGILAQLDCDGYRQVG